MTCDLEKSLKAKLRQIAKEKDQDPLAVWQNLILERFLARLARSSYQSYFVLKGGHLLSKYIQIGRETQDLDFFAKNLKNEMNVLREIFSSIALLDIGDGFEFKNVMVRSLSHPHMTYLGAHISMMGFFGKIRFKVDIDLGFADIVKAIQKDLPLLQNSKGPLFEKSIQLHCYPQEFIFAEKLETILYRGGDNSRMKDFHDLHSMIVEPENLDLGNLEEAVALVFAHRKTSLNLPIRFSAEEVKKLEAFWISYHQQLNHKALKQPIPSDFAELLETLNHWLRVNL